MLVVAVEYQYELRNLKKHFSHLVTKLNLLEIGVNALTSITRTKTQFIKER